MTNDLELQPGAAVETKVVEGEIEKALQRVEHVDTRRIVVSMKDNCVFLRGDVKTWREQQAVSKAAAAIEGVRRVQNELRIAPWLF